MPLHADLFACDRYLERSCWDTTSVLIRTSPDSTTRCARRAPPRAAGSSVTVDARGGPWRSLGHTRRGPPVERAIEFVVLNGCGAVHLVYDAASDRSSRRMLP